MPTIANTPNTIPNAMPMSAEYVAPSSLEGSASGDFPVPVGVAVGESGDIVGIKVGSHSSDITLAPHKLHVADCGMTIVVIPEPVKA